MQYLEHTIIHENETAKLRLYLIDNLGMTPDKVRPLVLICPGGAYAYTSEREAEPIALSILGRGYHAAILYYTCNPEAARKEAEFPTALVQIAKAIRYLREHSAEFHADPERIILSGFSAGGHAALSLGVFWKRPFLQELMQTEPESYRPSALLLAYPVVTSGTFTHSESMHNLLGDRVSDPSWLELVSLEKQVDASMPPAFIWTTDEDGAVPAENSLELALAMRRAGVSAELHMYRHGSHGLSLANKEVCPDSEPGQAPWCEVQNWIDLADTWIKGL